MMFIYFMTYPANKVINVSKFTYWIICISGSHISGKERTMWISKEQTFSHKTKNSGIWQNYELEYLEWL